MDPYEILKEMARKATEARLAGLPKVPKVERGNESIKCASRVPHNKSPQSDKVGRGSLPVSHHQCNGLDGKGTFNIGEKVSELKKRKRINAASKLNVSSVPHKVIRLPKGSIGGKVVAGLGGQKLSHDVIVNQVDNTTSTVGHDSLKDAVGYKYNKREEATKAYLFECFKELIDEKKEKLKEEMLAKFFDTDFQIKMFKSVEKAVRKELIKQEIYNSVITFRYMRENYGITRNHLSKLIKVKAVNKIPVPNSKAILYKRIEIVNAINGCLN